MYFKSFYSSNIKFSVEENLIAQMSFFLNEKVLKALLVILFASLDIHLGIVDV